MKIEQLPEILEKIKRAKALINEARSIDDCGSDISCCLYTHDVPNTEVSLHLYKGLELIAKTLNVTEIGTKLFDDGVTIQKSFIHGGVYYFQLYIMEETKNV